MQRQKGGICLLYEWRQILHFAFAEQYTCPYYNDIHYSPGIVFSYKLRYIVVFGLVEMTISTNPKPTIYRNLYDNMNPGVIFPKQLTYKLASKYNTVLI